jgi:alanine racemase
MEPNLDNFVEVIIDEPDTFLKIKETLTRIGVASKKDRKLYQSCHILHKRGRYYITHFKEMFLLDGKESTFSEEDRQRRNTIINLLEEWGLITVINKNMISDRLNLSNIKILPYKEKNDWQLVAKYSIGSKR